MWRIGHRPIWQVQPGLSAGPGRVQIRAFRAINTGLNIRAVFPFNAAIQIQTENNFSVRVGFKLMKQIRAGFRIRDTREKFSAA